MPNVATGLDSLQDGDWRGLKNRRLGLLSNQASLDSHLRSSREIIAGLFPGRLRALFGPQHGHMGADQDNMIETAHAYDRELNIPVFSLYSEGRKPTFEMLELIDTLIIDLQDVGTRVYTFASTMLNCLQAAAAHGKRILVLDRPNPLGGKIVEGNLLSPELFSFVGPSKLPMRHGLTMGEMARIFNHEYGIGCDLHIIPVKGWRREMLWQDTGLRWVMPSPNMPLQETAHVYPGQVLWEGTNISEGRGTCRPFEIFGAPFLETDRIRQHMNQAATEGVHLQEISFRPTFHKWAGHLCPGFMIHILDPQVYQPYFMTLSLLKAILEIHRHAVSWKSPPYEYEHEKMPIDLILGDTSLRRGLEKGLDLNEAKEKWHRDHEYYFEWREPFLLYKD